MKDETIELLLTGQPVNLHPSYSAEAIQAELFTLCNKDGSLCISVLSYGATLCRVVYRVDNQDVDLICSLPEPDDYGDESVNVAYLGATMGRYSRCISHGKFELDGVMYQLDRNIENHHFHGGFLGFDKRIWKQKETGRKENGVLYLILESEDGDQAYPGKVLAEAIYRLSGDELVIEYKATTTKRTHVALTNHSFWTLGAKEGIDQLHMKIDAAKTVEMDAELIPTGDLSDVENTPLDFRNEHVIASTKLDNCFILEESGGEIVLFNPENGVRAKLVTNQSVLAVYTGDHLPLSRQGICLQPTCWPDSPNQKHFPSTVLNVGELYSNRMEFKFSCKDGEEE